LLDDVVVRWLGGLASGDGGVSTLWPHGEPDESETLLPRFSDVLSATHA
jgi:hypothetical protein